MPFLRASGTACVCLLVFAIGLAAQRVSGVVSDADAGSPVHGAMVVLVDAAGKRHASGLTGAAGRFTFLAREPGRYSLLVQRIGFRDVQTPSFELVGAGEFELDIAARPEPVVLDGITADATRRCVSRPGGTAAVATLWAEARKALEAAAHAERQRLYRFTIANFRRELDSRTLRVRRELTRARTSWADASPFVSAPRDRLLRDGFIMRDGSGWSFYAPDAGVLLSDEFLDAYCFRVVESPGDRPELIGLGFQPESGTGPPAISGTLWLDRATFHLRYVEHGYARVRFAEGPTAHIGGRVEFEALPNGTWIVRRWWIRMPLLRERAPVGHVFGRRPSTIIAGLIEEGGEVLELTDLPERPAPLAPRR